jgi:hypothetical protein
MGIIKNRFPIQGKLIDNIRFKNVDQEMKKIKVSAFDFLIWGSIIIGNIISGYLMEIWKKGGSFFYACLGGFIWGGTLIFTGLAIFENLYRHDSLFYWIRSKFSEKRMTEMDKIAMILIASGSILIGLLLFILNIIDIFITRRCSN